MKEKSIVAPVLIIAGVCVTAVLLLALKKADKQQTVAGTSVKPVKQGTVFVPTPIIINADGSVKDDQYWNEQFFTGD